MIRERRRNRRLVVAALVFTWLYLLMTTWLALDLAQDMSARSLKLGEELHETRAELILSKGRNIVCQHDLRSAQEPLRVCRAQLSTCEDFHHGR